MVKVGYGFGLLCIIGAGLAAPGWALLIAVGYVWLLWLAERLTKTPRK